MTNKRRDTFENETSVLSVPQPGRFTGFLVAAFTGFFWSIKLDIDHVLNKLVVTWFEPLSMVVIR